MRKLIYFTMVSLDGYIDKPDANLDWVVIDEELHTYVNEQERKIGTYLYGRRMYELMQGYWPTADEQSDLAFMIEYSKIWKQIPKVVFSTTLEQVEGNARLVKGDPVAEVIKLKEVPGNDIEVGGAILAGRLIQAGLVDEYRLFFQPVFLGGGSRMVPDLTEAIKLKLVESHTFHSGVVYHRYQANQ
jgi:dihydrofolate reductase